MSEVYVINTFFSKEMGETFVEAQTSMTFRQILIFYEFFQAWILFLCFQWFSMILHDRGNPV